ncbi:hypothetical protein ABC347_03700 [Sphingomonas sp. 1P06PA]|uniref:hypothetical protein n=1 Tax=Sphingomonas sp. 1P06PA TaxID=554121 RepID=UPI0039A6381F
MTLAPRPPIAAAAPTVPPAPPDIHIVIGRVELTVPPPPFERSPSPVESLRRQPQSLDDYLAAKRQA